MGHRHDPKDRRPFPITPLVMTNFLLEAVSQEGITWFGLVPKVKKAFSVSNWDIEVKEPLSWLVRQGFLKFDGEVYKKP